jgi:hypothetical protein
MSVVCVLTPVVIASWPTLSAAVVSAAASLGYAVAETGILTSKAAAADQKAQQAVELEISQSEIVTDSLGRGQTISVAKDGVVVTFSRDPRGKASLHVRGNGQQDDSLLRAMGEQLGQRVVQKYVYQRLMEEMKARDFHVVEEEVEEDQSIRLLVRHWDN